MWFIPALFACSAEPPKTVDRSPEDTAVDSDDTGPSGPCPAWSGLEREGTVWTRGYSDAYAAKHDVEGGWTLTVTRFDGGSVEVTEEGHTTADWNTYFTTTVARRYTCTSEGLFLVRETVRTVTSTKGGDKEASAVSRYDPPVLVQPPDLEVGSRWTSHFVGTREGRGGGSEAIDRTVTSEVVAEEEVTVPAGTWPALSVVDEDGASHQTSGRWLARDPGWVRDDSRELVTYSP